MKRSGYTINFALFLVFTLFVNEAFTQSYKNFSRYAGGSGIDEVSRLLVINGETYLLGYTRSANFPVTNGSVYKGENDITLVKYAVDGTIIYATYIGGRVNETVTSFVVSNGEVYLAGYTESNNFNVTNGSVYKGGKDIFVTKISSLGQITFSTYLGAAKDETPVVDGLHINGNELFISGTTASINFPVTDNTLYSGGTSDIFISKLNATDGSILSSTIIGGNKTENLLKTEFENGNLYLMGTTFSTNLPVTIGGPSNDTLPDCFVAKLNAANLQITYWRYLGGKGSDFPSTFKVVNGIVHVAGFTYSLDYPVINGSSTAISGLDYADGFYTRLNPDGSIGYSTYLSTNDLDIISDMVVSNNEIYIGGRASSPFNGERKLQVFKLNTGGNLIYSKRFSLGYGDPGSFSFISLNNNLYITGISQGVGYPVTDNSQFYNGGTGFFTKLDPAGNILYSSFLGKMNNLLPMQLYNNSFYILGSSDLLTYPITDMSTLSGSTDNILVIKKTDGTNLFGGYVGGSSTDVPSALQVNAGNVYFAGKTSSANFPVTYNIPYQANGDQYITKLSFCPGNYFVEDDTLSPKVQTACRFGLAKKITGIDLIVPSDSLPLVYINGLINLQPPVKAVYQWQSSNSSNGPWANITSAIFKDFTPVLGSSSQYYRRLSFTLPECGNILIHISDTATVLANLLTAPSINAGGPFNTCTGTPIRIGGSPTVTGGNPPYTSYSWDMGASSVANPTVTAGSNTIFTLIVTDNLGCQQAGQAIVLTYHANAGPDKGACGGTATQIAATPVPGLSGVTYAWEPTTGLNATNIAQPFANPLTITAYEMTLTIPTSDGITCSTKDTVIITPVAAPLTVDIAGPDKVICLADSAQLGKPAEQGFNYVWSPGSYLAGNVNSITYYYPGNIIMPVPNPATLYITAQKNGCSFPDEVVVATIEARAGKNFCGPRLVGLPDRTPDINETYSWTLISGPGNFTGATNLPQVPVSASVGGPTVYGLTVSYNGISCFDQVTVPAACSGCQVTIEVEAKYNCPGYDVNGGNVSLIAFSGIADAFYTWSPQVGLSNYTGNIVHLIDNLPRIYTVTATDLNDSSVQCTYNIFVNDPAFSRPVFPAPDTVACIGIPVTIGLPPVSGYSYLWAGTGLSSNLISNPTAIVTAQTAYPVLVSDGNGCQLLDTVIVRTQNTLANAGNDWIICSSGIVKLGSVAQPNTTYLWEPQSAPWQNGTNQNSAQPEVFIANDITFTVTATSSAGCVSSDGVNITINAIPTLPDAHDTILCLNKPILIGSPALAGVIYNWTPTLGLSNPNIAQPLANPAVTTTYSLTASFPGNCNATAIEQITVTVSNPTFNLPDINYCPGNGPISLGANAPVNMLSYNWSPANLVTNPAIANPSTTIALPALPTPLTLTVVNTDGCIFKDTIRLIPASSPPEAGVDRTICISQSTAIGSATNATGPSISYQWNPSINLNDPLIANPIFTSLTGGTFSYVLIKTDSQLSCITTDTVVVTVADVIIPVINTPIFCENSCNQIGTTALPGIQYQWLPDTGLSNAYIPNPQACVGVNTVSYTLTATNIFGCSNSATVVVGVTNIPPPQVNIPNVVICVGAPSATFNPTITPAGSYTYLWSPDNSTLNNVNILSPTISSSVVGNFQYQLQVTDTNTGCSNRAFANLTVNDCSQLAIVGDFVWYDANFNGLQDATEFGETGITVHLYNSADLNVGNAVTDGNGQYYFTNIIPGNNYYVIFDLPAGYSFTQQNTGGITATNNSKANTVGRSNNFNILPGASILNIDAGIIPEGCGGPVPVTLLNFNGTLRNRQTFLNWQTSSEFNNDYFSLERSNSAVFTAIGRVNGNGTSLLLHNYSFIDQAPLNGVNYYRLKQVDFDGNYRYSHIIPIFMDNDLVVNAYYNSLNNSIRIIFNKAQDNVQLKLFNSNAQLIKVASTSDNITDYNLNLPVVASGIYVLQIINEKTVITKKIMIVK